MSCAVLFEEQLRIPPINSLADFRRWLRADDFPRRGRIDYVSSQIEVDMSPEDLFMHSTPKTEIAMGIYARVKQMEAGGEVFVDRTRVTCPTADLSVEPDIVYISHQTLDSEKIKLVPKAREEPDRYIEIEGPPDLVVEIVSDSSESKDTRRLPTAYFLAGVRELWLVDVRTKNLRFEIYRRGRSRFIPAAKKDGYQRSLVLGCSYRLTRRRDRAGWLKYELRAQP
jgi:Uma2 family endonuclease